VVEAGLNVTPFEGLVLTADYTYLNTRILQIPNFTGQGAGLYSIVSQYFPGDPLPQSPMNKTQREITMAEVFARRAHVAGGHRTARDLRRRHLPAWLRIQATVIKNMLREKTTASDLLRSFSRSDSNHSIGIRTARFPLISVLARGRDTRKIISAGSRTHCRAS
jgi:hypothetical protein